MTPEQKMKNLKFIYLLQLADNALMLGQRLAEWCGHGPVLEQDMALTNIALDQIGQARSLYQYAAEIEGEGKTEDDLAYLRDVWGYRNVLLVERPNGDFAQTIVRQFLFDAFNYYQFQLLCHSKDEQLAAIAKKALKEITYHLRFSSEWMIRLGDGTKLSHQKMQRALDELWMYTGELTTSTAIETQLGLQGIAADLGKVKSQYLKKLNEIITRATLKLPTDEWMQQGGKEGHHSEHLGYILAELQFLQRAYPNQNW